MDVLEHFTAPTAAWFRSSFDAPTKAQTEGWAAIGSGVDTLIHAPTGSGKTLAAFLWAIDRLYTEPSVPDEQRCRVLYVSPLKALAHDIDRNLRAPLHGIRHAAERMGAGPLPELRTFVRTGDTPAADRGRMRRQPPDILITTPESLHLLLTSQAAEVLASVRWVIVDEVHAVAGTKRGAHLALCLERLEERRRRDTGRPVEPLQRIGLSATQRPIETIAEFLAGGEPGGPGGAWRPRPVTVVDAGGAPSLELELTVPVADMTAPVDPAAPAEEDQQAARPLPRTTIWTAIRPRILELIDEHRSTIVFVNSRRQAERLSNELNELAGEEISRAHHGSIAREQRIQIEEALKRGALKAVVATSSLELGIDMGAVDLVVQVEAPTSVASGLQRVGRAGHQVAEVSRAKILPKHRGDLLVATVVGKLMAEGQVERTVVPRHPLDVLAQQLVAIVCTGEFTADELYDLVRGAAPYAQLPRSAFDATLDMLAGRYPSDAFAELRPRVVWDRITGVVTARPGARVLASTNAGTIPDRGMYRVALPDGARVGELDEEMVYESREGDVFVLGSTSWRIVDITPDTVVVTPAPGEPAAQLPYWHGDQPGRPIEAGRAVGRFVRRLSSLPAEQAARLLREEYHLDEFAAANLLTYLAEEKAATGVLPDDRTIVVQRFRDEIGDWRVVILSPLGAKVHAPWAMALTQRLRARLGYDVDMIYSDDGIAFRFPDADEVPSLADLQLDPEEVEQLVVDHLAGTALFAARFREAAGRSLLLPRRRPGSRTPLWLQRRRAADLLSVARQFGSFPIVLECYREILQDDFDLPALLDVLGEIQRRGIRLVDVELPSASPFASSLLFAFVAAYLYEADAPLAERRAMALTLDRELLAELLGESELREMLSAEVIAAVEHDLQRLTEDRQARSAEEVADMLRHLGPLTPAAIAVRCAEPSAAEGYVAELLDARRACQVRIRGEVHVAAAEDIARLRDALGIQPPQGVPDAFLEPVADPLGDVVARYARTHGPFAVADAAEALGLPVAVVESTLERLAAGGSVVHGAFDPRGEGTEWAGADVLRRIKRGSLAELRGEIEPVPAERLGTFLPAWHGVSDDPPSGRDALVAAVEKLQGVPIPATVLESDVLAARVADPAPMLDALMAEGAVVWVGAGALGSRDGKVALYLRDQAELLLRSGGEPPEGEPHAAIVQHLGERGASFFPQLQRAAGCDQEEALSALWDLVWAGVVSNDTFAPVRAFVGRGRTVRGRSAVPPRAAGRWTLVADLLNPQLSPTQFAAAWTEQLLERHGVVTRAAVAAEGIPGGFSGLYPVLAQLEETGRARRGYFVEGLGGAQFALPGAIGRLRAADGGDQSVVQVLAATDPANPYGATLEWPSVSMGRLARVAGASVVLVDGRLVAYVEGGGRALRRLDPSPDLDGKVAAALAGLARRTRRFVVATVDGEPVHRSGFAAVLGEHGFVPTARGMRWSPRAGG
ncbi:DEAD/DEAH box helicase [Thermocrispum sp.]|nr:DEAD/DEAH box helicase [Thermocrispum sp.]